MGTCSVITVSLFLEVSLFRLVQPLIVKPKRNTKESLSIKEELMEYFIINREW